MRRYKHNIKFKELVKKFDFWENPQNYLKLKPKEYSKQDIWNLLYRLKKTYPIDYANYLRLKSLGII